MIRSRIGPLLPGLYDDVIPVMEAAALARRLSGATPLPQTLDDRLTGASAIREDRVAGHAALTMPVGSRVTMTMGLRIQAVDLGGRFWLAGHDGVAAERIPYGWNRIHARYPAILPNVSAHWHRSSTLTVDAALWTSQTRPSPYQLTGGGGVTQDSWGAITIHMPAPRLKPVDALNLDLAMDWQPGPGLRLSIAGFAKRLDHYLYDAGDTQNNASLDDGEATVRLARSRNGGTAAIGGIETSVAVPLIHLGSAMRNWSLGGQLTMLDGGVRLRNPALAVVERLQYALRLSTRSWLRYDDGRVSLDLSWRMSSPYIQEYGLQVALYGGSVFASSSALDSWVHPAGQLDLGLGLHLGRSLLRFGIRNITDTPTYRSSIGRFSTMVPQTIIGGRQIQFSISTRQ
ncbi:TonB-dependent receptor [uncultured Sphingomonas sp.]|uniref:TonB-dependent receptor domain-containing protein n=1 Tax=uncultured Sphingomonas sp. TaxID=158754 RepID=UPI0025CE7EF0|nr:TonB-dependent receptor [uncultured Sphingomonas sp.]